MSRAPSVLGWWFCGATMRDGRPVPRDGETLRHDRPVVPCKSGLHASPTILDALPYAPGATLCRVRLSGEIVPHGVDKWAASERSILWRVEAGPVLRAFARWCALRVVSRWNAPAVVVRYLRTGDESIREQAMAAAYAADAAYVTDYDVDVVYASAAAIATRDVAARKAEFRAQAAQLARMVREAKAGRASWMWPAPRARRKS